MVLEGLNTQSLKTEVDSQLRSFITILSLFVKSSFAQPHVMRGATLVSTVVDTYGQRVFPNESLHFHHSLDMRSPTRLELAPRLDLPRYRNCPGRE